MTNERSRSVDRLVGNKPSYQSTLAGRACRVRGRENLSVTYVNFRFLRPSLVLQHGKVCGLDFRRSRKRQAELLRNDRLNLVSRRL
jgi:hypothetical protein